MFKRIISLVISILIVLPGLILTNSYIPAMSKMLGYDLHATSFFGMPASSIILVTLGAIWFGWLALILPPFITNSLFNYAEKLSTILSKVPTSDILVMVFGVGTGLIMANLIGAPLSRLPIFGPYIPIILSVILSVIGASLSLKKRNDLVDFFTHLPGIGSKEEKQLARQTTEVIMAGPMGDRQYSQNKLIDTSVIIDGRIMDILAAGFLEGYLIVPSFVLLELQALADSSDDMKRAKGRRGLDLVQDLKVSYKNQVLIVDHNFEDVVGVDSKLVQLAKHADCAIITNDFNLNKVAGIQGIKVLNINELANAIKPAVIAGEEMNVFVVKAGKEQGQGIAYLDDGTMIVIDGANRLVGKNVDIEVTSVLQTSAGRMIFAKLKR